MKRWRRNRIRQWEKKIWNRYLYTMLPRDLYQSSPRALGSFQMVQDLSTRPFSTTKYQMILFPCSSRPHTQQQSPSHSQPQNQQQPELLAKDNPVPHYASGFSLWNTDLVVIRTNLHVSDMIIMSEGFGIEFGQDFEYANSEYWRNKNRGWLRNWEHIRLTGKVW